MTSSRRLLSIALVLTMVLSLLFSVSASADEVILGKTTMDKVNFRVGASTSAKILFQIPQTGYVGKILGEKNAEGIHWYKVEFQSPEDGNDRYYTGYINGEFFTLLTEEEAAAYRTGDTVATPTPIPSADPETGETPTPTPTPDHSGSYDAPDGTVGVITNGGVNLRKGPSTSFGVITQLNRGDVVTVLTIPTVISDKTFYFVRYGNTEGFVMATFLRLPSDPDSSYTPTPVNTPTPTPTPFGVVGYVMTIKGGVNLRQTPDGTTITQVGRYKTFPVLLQPIEKNGYTWYFVQAGENKGYLRGDCVKDVTNTPEPTATPTPTPEPTVPANPTGYVKSTADELNVRDKAGNGSILGRISKNIVMPYYGEPQVISNVKWYKVYLQKYGYCYVHGNFVILCDADGNPIDGPTPTPTPTGTAPTETPTATPTPTPTPTGTAPTVPAGSTGYVKSTADGLNLRDKAGNGDVLGRIDKNVVMPYYGEPQVISKVKWYKVYYPKYGYCYVHGNFVILCDADGNPIDSPTPTPTPTADPTAPATGTPTPTPTPTEEPTGYLKTTAGGLNLRKEAGYTDVLGQLSAGVVLPYYGDPVTVKNVEWYRVKDPKYGFGYLHYNYVKKCNADGSDIVVPTTPPINPDAPQQEASYSTLKLGSTGNAVKNLTTELINQGYMSGSATDKYTTAVEKAVRAFQEAKGLTVDGIAGSATQHKLFNTVPIGTGDINDRTMTIFPAEKINWYTGGIQELWKRGDNYKVYDVYTGTVWWAHRWAGGNHADVEPLTAKDTAIICSWFGVSDASKINSTDHWMRRPSLVTIGTRTFACSLYPVPHNPDGDTIPDNNMTGQICLHFTNSKTHDSKRVDTDHQNAIQYAWEHAPNGHK